MKSEDLPPPYGMLAKVMTVETAVEPDQSCRSDDEPSLWSW